MAVLLGTVPVSAAVNLELRPVTDLAGERGMVDVGLYAVADGEETLVVSAMEVVLSWNADHLALLRAINPGTHAWSLYGLLGDQALDGLNDSLADGDALFTALSLAGVPITPEGVLVTTLRFRTLNRAEETVVMILPEVGDYSETKVLEWGAIAHNILNSLSDGTFAIGGAASLSAPDISVVAGRNVDIVVEGDIEDRSTFGVTLTVELVPRVGAVGPVSFTPAPPVDIEQAGDPWPGAGAFTPFDTDESTSVMLNGSVDDNGTILPAPVTYDGPLSLFPVTTDANALGFWDIRLFDVSGGPIASNWEGLYTTNFNGLLRVVHAGDGDGSGAVDLRDFSELQVCFTGPEGPISPPAYTMEPRLRCGVYDFDEDGDVDLDDLDLFLAVFAGPAG